MTEPVSTEAARNLAILLSADTRKATRERAADALRGLVAERDAARALLSEVIDYADTHRLSREGCPACSGRCFEEWHMLRAEAAMRCALAEGGSTDG